MTLSDLHLLFSAPADPALLNYGNYNPSLVALSLLVAIFSSWMALQLAGQAHAATSRLLRNGVLLSGSLALGCGVWAMHFIGMLAFDLCTAVTYTPGLTVLSLLPSVAASFVALSLLARQRLGVAALLTGGLLMGAGIGAMHYTGMAAMRMGLALRYDPAMFALSIVVAVALATLALWVRFGLRQMQQRLGQPLVLLVSAIVMGCAIAGMHYTGMAAARFVGVPAQGDLGDQSTFLALATSLVTISFIVVVVAANGWLRNRQLFRQVTRSESWMRALLTTTVDAVITVDGAGMVEEFNLAAERIFGWRRDDIVGRPVQLLMVNQQFDVVAALRGMLQQGQHGEAGPQAQVSDLQARRQDGSAVPVRCAVGHAAIDGRDLFVLFITDISDRQKMEQALRLARDKAEQAAAARASFLANMSHEIRTPMNSILGFTDVLLDTALAADQRRHLDTVRSAGRALLRLLNEVLDTAKLDKGAVELEVSDYGLLALIDELSSTIGARAHAKGLLLEVHYDAALPANLRGDELRMRQVLTNLLDNAVKFTASGTVGLHASASADGALLRLDVYDTGIGIAPERLEAIFEAFTQADASTTRAYGGTGLGTTICRQLVTLMDGRIWASSVAGQGTTFHVELPLLAAHEVPRPRPGRGVPFDLPPLHVLAADDVPQNLELLAVLLEQRGHTLETAGDGAQAVALAAAVPFDVILMDVQMPVLDGLAATRAIRAAAARDGRPAIPVVAMTASVLEAHRHASAGAGMNGYATKPVDWPALSHEIARVLGLEGSAAADHGEAGRATPAANRVLNLQAGLLRWNGSAVVYHAALHRYAVEHGGLARDLSLLLARGAAAAQHGGEADYPAAAALAHKARGVAANLGLEQLAATLVEFERHCGGAPEQDELDVRLRQLSTQVPAALYAIGTALASSAAPPAAEAPALQAPARGAVDVAAARAAGATLAAALRHGAFDDAAVATLVASLAGGAGAALAQLHAALADFNFAQAQTALHDVLAELDQDA